MKPISRSYKITIKGECDKIDSKVLKRIDRDMRCIKRSITTGDYWHKIISVEPIN